MAKMSRAERKRLGVQRPNNSTDAFVADHADEITDGVLASAQASSPSAPSSEPKSRLVRTTRRVVARDVAASLDYSSETAMIANDLRRIAFWGSVFVAIMLAIKFAGVL